MKSKTEKQQIRRFTNRSVLLITIIVDAVLLITFVGGILLYASYNEKKSYDQNIDSVTNISKANASLLQVALNNISSEVERAYNYCHDKEFNEIMSYLSTINKSDEEYQLLKFNEELSSNLIYVYEGYSTKKNNNDYIKVTYNDTLLSKSIYKYQSEINGKVSFTHSFTNETDTKPYFGAFCGINVIDQTNTSSKYYLVKLQIESKVLNYVQTSTQYENMAVAVCYIDGKYLARDSFYRTNNLFDYIASTNNLSLDQKTSLMNAVVDNDEGHGSFQYLDYAKRPCVYAYSICGDENQWMTIVAVPEDEFIFQNLLSFFPSLIIIFLAILLIYNILMLLTIVMKLRASVEREQFANNSKSSFLSRMSHEIRTPLNAIIGYNVIARGEFSSNKTDAERRQSEMKILDCLNKSEIASKQLLYVINDVLDMSAIENGKIRIVNEKFDFRGLITTLTMVYYSQARNKGINFEVIFDSITEEWFKGDQLRVNQILTNLLSNAIKFTPTGGKVHLRISQPEGKENKAHIRFEIIDTGIGMSEEYIKRIWSPFEQADSSITRRFGGSGLGLTITKSLVDLMKGTIKVESELGKGTTFTVDLQFTLLEEPPDYVHTYDFSDINVLIVDDDQGTCDYIMTLFNRCGARCATVTSGEVAVEAVKMAIEKNDLFTVCLIDWQMPNMDGIETIKKIREIVSDELPIVVISAYDYTEIAEQAIKYNITKFIAKPLFQSALFDLLADICGKRVKITKTNNDYLQMAGARIILAEDNQMNMEIAVHILKSLKLEVDCAMNGKEALDLFTSSPVGTYKAILMDIHMPLMDGLQATKEIRTSSHPEALTVPIIAMTADAFVENVAESKAAGMNDHISKPIEYQSLYETLKKYIIK